MVTYGDLRAVALSKNTYIHGMPVGGRKFVVSSAPRHREDLDLRT